MTNIVIYLSRQKEFNEDIKGKEEDVDTSYHFPHGVVMCIT